MSTPPSLARQLLYLAYMLRFSTLGTRPVSAHGAASRPGAPLAENPEALSRSIPAAAWRQLLADFTEPLPGAGASPSSSLAAAGGREKRKLTDPMRQKLALHAHALALRVAGGSVGTDAIAAPLALTTQKCAFYLRELGCKTESLAGQQTADGKKRRVATLKLPLVFPKPSRGPPKRSLSCAPAR